jgi:O-antigen/teichoic acid export membrane protein
LVLWWSSSWRPALRFSREDANASLAFGAKVMGASVLKAARDQGEPLLIGVLLGAPSLGFWSVATRIYTIVIELGVSVVSVVATPAFALVRRDTARLQRAYRRATSVSATVVIPLLVVLSAVSDDLIPLVFGEQWRRSGELASILTIMALFAVLVNFDGPVYLAIGRPGVELALTAFIVAFHLATVAAVAHWGLMPLAVALLARAALSWPVRVVALKRVAGIDWRAYAGTAVCFLCAGLAAVVMAITEQLWLTGHDALSVAGTSLAGIAIYLVTMSFSKDFRDLAKQLLASASRRRNAASTPRPFAEAKAGGDACAGDQTGPRDAVNE